MKIRPSIAFVAVAALTAVAFAPSVSTTLPLDGKGRALAAGALDLTPAADTAIAPVGAACTLGFAGPFPCDGVDLASYVSLAELGGGAGSDSWGWVDDMDTPGDTSDDRYIALMGTSLGLTYTDITDPKAPVVLGRTTMTPGDGVVWRDVKVHDGHAFFVSEEAGYGVKSIDLTALRDVAPSINNEIPVVGTYMDPAGGNAHNIWINEDTARAYVAGTGSVGNQGPTGGNGQAILDISDPANPVEIGFIDEVGYSHDLECVIYTGPDDDYNGNNTTGDADGDATNGAQAELCFLANEDWMRVVDVTDPVNTRLIATIGYETAAYAHQGVLTDDMQWLLFNDEVDETNVPFVPLGVPARATRTYWVDISDLDQPMWQDEFVQPGINDGVCVYTHELDTIDHNMYVTGDLLWQANYNGGLRVFRINDTDLANCTMQEIGFFDVDPGLDVSSYGGAWNIFPHFGQDRLVLSTLDEGLYILQSDFEVGES